MNKQEQQIWLNANYTPIVDEQGNTSWVIKLANDITERIQQQQLGVVKWAAALP